jgi:transcription initiation factor TFIIIB Brf1 subunit/transcription initiation factor TFIIB
METILCPYCECRVRVSDVDDEGGVCPECGAVITGSHLIRQVFDNDIIDDDDDEDEVKPKSRRRDLDELDDFDEDFDEDEKEDEDEDDF